MSVYIGHHLSAENPQKAKEGDWVLPAIFRTPQVARAAPTVTSGTLGRTLGAGPTWEREGQTRDPQSSTKPGDYHRRSLVVDCWGSLCVPARLFHYKSVTMWFANNLPNMCNMFSNGFEPKLCGAVVCLGSVLGAKLGTGQFGGENVDRLSGKPHCHRFLWNKRAVRQRLPQQSTTSERR